MLTIPLGKVKVAKDVAFSFPASLCCNCGATGNLKIIEQDTRQTKYFILGGTEMTFQLPLPFCPGCAASAKRRPRSIVHYSLLALFVFWLTFFGLIVAGDVVLPMPALSQYLVAISVATTALLIGLLLTISRPKGKQTSYFHPVRIKKLKREFVSGTVTAVRFAFTNPEYARAFVSENQPAIRLNKVEAVAV